MTSKAGEISSIIKEQIKQYESKIEMKENGTVIPDKSLQSSFIAPTATQVRNIRIIVMWIIPFIIAAVGVFVLLRRRNK